MITNLICSTYARSLAYFFYIKYHMQVATRRLTATLMQVTGYRFSGGGGGSKMTPWIGVENPIKHRVMSTPTWPAPYYQRYVKAYPVRRKSSGQLRQG